MNNRPIYHLHARPEEGICCPFDPNGAIFWKGRHHLMYIYQDPSLPDGGHCWGHLSSPDLIRWTRHPPALVPGPGDPDRGIFSGNAFLDRDGVPMLCWFGIDAGVCVASAVDDELMRWERHPGNPVIPIPKEGEPGYGAYTVWDPYLWHEDGAYHCLLGGNRLPSGKDTLTLCRSTDLVHWEVIGPFYDHPDPAWTEDDEDCSCPDFFRLGDRRVLLCISHKIGARAYIGGYDGTHFHPERHVRMNWPGGMYFAPESLIDDRGRRIAWAWVCDPRVGPSQRETGSGTMSLPRVLSMESDGTLRIEPAEEIEALRRSHRRLENVVLPADREIALDGIEGLHLELSLAIEMGGAPRIDVSVRRSPDDEERTIVSVDRERKELIVDMSRSTKRTDVTYGSPPFAAYGMTDASENKAPHGAFAAPFDAPGQTVRLRLFLDGPMLEAFADDRQCVTQMIYPMRGDSIGVTVTARGGRALLRSVDAFEMDGLAVE